MARISEMHYSNAFASSTGIAEFIEIALEVGEDPADFTVSFYHADGTLGPEINLTNPGVQVSFDTASNEWVYVIQNGPFNIQLTDPDGAGAINFEAYALTNIATNTVINFYDIGGGTINITPTTGLAAGATSVNIPVPTPPDLATYSIQFNEPNPAVVSLVPISQGGTGVVCFATGAMILTETGPRAVQHLHAGDKIITADQGLCPLRWVAHQTVNGTGDHAPIAFATARGPLLLSPNHRVLHRAPALDLLFGTPEALIAAKHMLGRPGVTRQPCASVTYYHLMFDHHALVHANGLLCESLYVSDTTLRTMPPAMHHEFGVLFPRLLHGGTPLGAMARPPLRQYEVRAAFAA